MKSNYTIMYSTNEVKDQYKKIRCDNMSEESLNIVKGFINDCHRAYIIDERGPTILAKV